MAPPLSILNTEGDLLYQRNKSSEESVRTKIPMLQKGLGQPNALQRGQRLTHKTQPAKKCGVYPLRSYSMFPIRCFSLQRSSRADRRAPTELAIRRVKQPYNHTMQADTLERLLPVRTDRDCNKS